MYIPNKALESSNIPRSVFPPDNKATRVNHRAVVCRGMSGTGGPSVSTPVPADQWLKTGILVGQGQFWWELIIPFATTSSVIRCTSKYSSSEHAILPRIAAGHDWEIENPLIARRDQV